MGAIPPARLDSAEAAAYPGPMPSPDAPALRRALLDHFDAHRRDLPWRGTDDPYAIWVSEVMLQQTRVDTVRPYWERWMRRFPTVAALAEADLDDVLREWEGLGYYSRARNLHGAARMVRERHRGKLPDQVDALRELPGVGEYTAGAVASIAFGRPEPAVDGNVRRVLSRLYDLEAPTPAALRRLAADLVPADRPGDFNQAMMELGATICTPRSPACDACPVARWCRARELGVQEERPLRKKRTAVPEETVETAVIVRSDGALLLTRRPEYGLLGGLWEFPGDDAPEAVRRLVADLLAEADPVATLEPVVHTFTHKRVTYVATVWDCGDVRDPVDRGVTDGDVAWVNPDRLDEYALPVAMRRIARLVESAKAG